MATHKNDLQLVLEFDPKTGSGAARQCVERAEKRDPMIRLAEYSPFPWTNTDQRRNEAVTLNISQTGICLRVGAAVEPGAMLRVIIRDLDGKPHRDTLARVAWCRDERNGDFVLGLALVAEMGRSVVRVRRSGQTRWAEVA